MIGLIGYKVVDEISTLQRSFESLILKLGILDPELVIRGGVNTLKQAEEPRIVKIQPTDDLVVFRRPHFELRNGSLFFLLSTRPHAELDEKEAKLWAMIDGITTIGQLKQAQPGAEERLGRFWDSGIFELAPLRFPQERKRILVVEPHMDDAILSVGGLMWSLRESCEFTLLSVAGRSNFTSYYSLERDFFDVEKVSQLRKSESTLVMRLLGGQHAVLEELEAPLRYQAGDWTLDWFKQHRKSVGEFVVHSASDDETESWAAAIERFLLTVAAEEIWLPLGIGIHTDHELTRNACLRVLRRLPNVESRMAIFLYEDVPYASQFPAHTAQVVGAIAEAGGVLEPQASDITCAFDAKLRLLSIYGSQFKMSFMSPRVEVASRFASPSGEGCCERRFKMNRIPGAVAPLSVYSGRKVVEDLVIRLGPWYRRHRMARRVRLLCPVPVGRWADDMQLLLQAFPQAILEVHVSRRSLAETEELSSPRIDVRPVGGLGGAWLQRLIRLAVSRPCPMITLMGQNHLAGARVARVACFLSDTFIATRMTHFVQAVEGVLASPRAASV